MLPHNILLWKVNLCVLNFTRTCFKGYTCIETCLTMTIVEVKWRWVHMYTCDDYFNNIVSISSNRLHWNAVNWRKWPYREKENATISLIPFGFSIRVLLAHWPSPLARHEKKEQVTTGNHAVLQSVIGTSERWSAETLVPSTTVLTAWN